MAMPQTPYRLIMVPASFRGVQFQVEQSGISGGRRNVTFEYPKQDTPYTEDMGRRARRWDFRAYIISPNYVQLAQQLMVALDQGGVGTLQLPTFGSVQVNVEDWKEEEVRERGGICTFALSFVEAGSLTGSGVIPNTAQAVVNAASALAQSTIATLNSNVQALTT